MENFELNDVVCFDKFNLEFDNEMKARNIKETDKIKMDKIKLYSRYCFVSQQQYCKHDASYYNRYLTIIQDYLSCLTSCKIVDKFSELDGKFGFTQEVLSETKNKLGDKGMEVKSENRYKLYCTYFDLFLNGLSGCGLSTMNNKIKEDKVKLYTAVKNSVDMKIGIIDYFMALFEKQYKKSQRDAQNEELETEKKLIIDLNSCTEFISFINYPKLTARYEAITGVYKKSIDSYFDIMMSGFGLNVDEDAINFKEKLYEKVINNTYYDYIHAIEKFAIGEVSVLNGAKRLSKARKAEIAEYVSFLDNPYLTYQYNKIFNKSQIFNATIEIENTELKKTLN